MNTPASHRLAATDNMLHCFDLLNAESAGRIPLKQAHGAMVRFYGSMSRENRYYRSELMPAKLKQVFSHFLARSAYEMLAVSETW
jgi:hypothetical protein